MSDQETGIALPETDAGHTSEGNLTFQEAVLSRLAQKTEPEEESSDDPSEVEEVSEDLGDGSDGEESGDAPTELESLSDEQIAEFAKRHEKGLLKRLGKLVAEKKASQEESERLRLKLEQKPEPVTPRASANPYAEVNSIAELETKRQQAEEFIEWAEAVIDENGDTPDDGVIHEEKDGKEWTKKEVRAVLRNAQKAVAKAIPTRIQEIQQEEVLEQQSGALTKQAHDEIEWMNDPESDLAKEYKSYMDSPVVKRAIKAVPELKPLMPYMLAHAINSYKGTAKAIKAPVAPKPSPPRTPRSSAAPPSSEDEGSRSKHIAELEKRFNETGSVQDAARLRAAKQKQTTV